VIPAEIAKQRAIIQAQADAERIRENAKGEADAIFAKMEAEAKGLFEILTKQAQGYELVVKAAGGDPTKAFQLLLLEKLPELVKTQVEAVKNIKIDKITVWDSGNGTSDNGNSSTANFVSGMMKTVPPLNDLFNMAGLNLPTYLKGENEPPAATVVPEPPAKK
jgi:flotillin